MNVKNYLSLPLIEKIIARLYVAAPTGNAELIAELVSLQRQMNADQAALEAAQLAEQALPEQPEEAKNE